MEALLRLGANIMHGRITRQVNRLVRWIMIEAARLIDDRFRELCERYAGRKGRQKAIVAHEMLRIVYYMLKRGKPYRGGDRCLSMTA